MSEITRSDSAAYWDADGWDPDERIYTGSAVDGCDKFAVDQDKLQKTPQAELPKTAMQAEASGQSSKTAGDTPASIRRTGSADFWDGCMGAGVTPTGHGTQMAVASMLSKGHAGTPSVTEMAGVSGAELSEPMQDSTGYWDANVVGTSTAAPHGAPAPAASAEDPKMSAPGLPRVDSGSYWFADQWDPDNRIYTGAGAGQVNHLVAVLESGGEVISRAWSGGLTADIVKFDGEVGTPLTLSELMGSSPSVKDLYDIETRSVGCGAFAMVRPAMHRASGTSCVVKALSKIDTGPKYQKAVQDFLYKTLLKASLDTPHDNLVKYLDFLEGPDNFYVIMEQLEGNDLLQKVEAEHPFEEAYVRSVARQVLSSLHHLHDTVGLVHRDVKMANFRFRAGSESGLALIDLQFACQVEGEWDQAVCGTPALMAPELIAKCVQKGLLQAMDVWSAGVIFFRLMAKDLPFADEQELETLSKLGQEAAALVTRAVNHPKLAVYSSEARDLLRSMLTLEAAGRPSAKDALDHIYFK